MTIQCDNCNHSEEVKSWDAMGWAKRCVECANDACEKCEDKEHPGYHRDCWAQIADMDNS